MENYYIGLDIGTNSVGWAVTDRAYNILKRKGKRMWGIRLFESADTAAERRAFRASRRRLQRRKQRIDLMHGEIKKLACASLSTPCGAQKGDLKNSLFEPVV